jgi:cytosine/creatinine deaminase
MDFSLRCAWAHGTAALRTHLINMSPRQVALTWPAFVRARERWAGRVALQGVSLVVLSFYRDAAAAEALADTVAAAGGALGAAVCCAEDGGDSADEWTTCPGDRHTLLDRVFSLAASRGLDVDFHTDENGNAAATGLVDVCAAAQRARAASPPFTGRVVCGHCCALAAYPPDRLTAALAAARAAGVTVVSLPLVNQWTQDRDRSAARTPRWRGLTTLRELEAAGVPVALASDNVRDQFYAYGDYDLLEVLREGVRGGHLDCPYGGWAASITATPAAAMGLEGAGVGSLRVGGPADLVAFRARSYSELLARPQADRVVIRGGRAIDTTLPDYEELAHVRPQRGFDSSGAPSGVATPAKANGGGGSGGGSEAAAAAAALRAAAGSPPPGPPRGLEGGVDYEFGLRAKRALTPQPSLAVPLPPDTGVGGGENGGGGGGGSGDGHAPPPPPPPPATTVALAALAGAVAGAVAVGAALGRRA